MKNDLIITGKIYRLFISVLFVILQRLTRTGTIEKLFTLLGDSLKMKGLIINEGKMVDASFAPVPIQRNTPEENNKIKDGDDLWNDNPKKKSHKGTDALVHDSQALKSLLKQQSSCMLTMHIREKIRR